MGRSRPTLSLPRLGVLILASSAPSASPVRPGWRCPDAQARRDQRGPGSPPTSTSRPDPELRVPGPGRGGPRRRAGVRRRRQDAAVRAHWGGAYYLDGRQRRPRPRPPDRPAAAAGGNVIVSFGGRSTRARRRLHRPGEAHDAYALGRRALRPEHRSTSTSRAPHSTDAAAEPGGPRRSQALQRRATRAGKDLHVWLTLPGRAQGLTATGSAAVAAMLDAGVDLRAST